MSSEATGQIRLEDEPERQQALNTTMSCAVSAPAGSGKTELLIQRTLKLLCQVDQPENILAITFTRKAASEMRDRILQALHRATDPKPAESPHQSLSLSLARQVLARDHELGWQLLDNPGRLRIQTIDALCRQLANQLCLDSAQSLPANMTDDAEALYLEAAQRTIQHLEDSSPIGDALRHLVVHLDGNLPQLAGLIADLLGSRDSWLPLVISGKITESYLNDRIESLVQEALTEAQSQLHPFESRLQKLIRYALQHVEGADWLNADLIGEQLTTSAAQLPHWKALRAFLLTGSGEFRSPRAINKRLGFPTQTRDGDKKLAQQNKQEFNHLIEDCHQVSGLKQAIDLLEYLPDFSLNADILELEAQDLHQSLFLLLSIAAAEFDLLSRERGETDYTAVAIAALDALGSAEQPTPLALRLDYRIQHILVDEFQDTSSVQEQLLQGLTSGWESDDGRTLFIVGDGMQSIYSFRKANVSLFIRARNQGIGSIRLNPLDLSANFRSDQQILDWINPTFSALFPQQDDLVMGQVAYTRAQAVRPKSNWPVELRGFSDAELEAEAMADDIAAKLQAGSDSLAILVRNRAHLRAILPALRQRDIRWSAQDIDPLANRMAVLDIHSLTRALCVPADNIAWYAILRAPWAGLEMADLLQIAEWDDPDMAVQQPVWSTLHALSCHAQSGLSPAGQQILRRLKAEIESAQAKLGRQSLRHLVESLWHSLDGPQTLLEHRDHADVQDYLELLEQQETAGLILDWVAFERRLKQLYARPDPTANARLQIMTIHKAKGLEFDHIYLPGLNRKSGRGENPLMLWWERQYEDGSEAYLLSVRHSINQPKTTKRSLYDFLKYEERQRQRQENIRLLYVACTRARKSLFLSAALDRDSDSGKIKSPGSDSMLNLLWDQHQDEFCNDMELSSEVESPSIKTLSVIRRLDPGRRADVSPAETEPAANSQGNSPVSEMPGSFQDNYHARILGDLLHQTLMRVVQARIQAPMAEMFVSDWQRAFLLHGVKAHQTELELKLTQQLNRIFSDATGRWILDPNHDQSEAELEIDFIDANGGIKRSVIDRTFVDQNQRWIIDYKSSTPKDDADVKEFLRSEAQRYQSQLHHYRSLFGESRIRCLLYFPAIAEYIEIN